MEKLIQIKDKVYELKDIMSISQMKNSSVSLVTEEYIDDILENKKDLGDMSVFSIESKNNGLDNFSDCLLLSPESEIDYKSNKKKNSNCLGKKSRDNRLNTQILPKDTFLNLTYLNHFLKNNSKVEKKNDQLNETSLDLSESSSDNESTNIGKYAKKDLKSMTTAKKKNVIFKNFMKEEFDNKSIVTNLTGKKIKKIFLKLWKKKGKDFIF
jgi:hypothetical protein